MKTLKKILSILGDVLVGIILLISLMIIVSTISTKKTGTPSAFGIVTSSVQSNSMQPVFEKGDFVVGIVQNDDYEYKVGDIVTFKSIYENQNILLSHRIVAINEDGSYVTRGDNYDICTDVDPDPLLESEIVCLYKFRIPKLGYVVDFLKTTVGFVLCVMLPMLIFIGVQIYKIIDIYMKSKKEEMLSEAKAQTSDDVKDAIIKEYLEKQKALENNVENKNE